MLEAIHVSKSFRGEVEALRDVNLTVAERETIALVGESGSGKTTLLRLFNRLEEPSQGEVRIGGRPAASHDPVLLRRRIGYVQQDGGLLPHWTVARNVALVPELLGWETKRRSGRVDELLELVGLDPATYRGIHRWCCSMSRSAPWTRSREWSCSASS
jgi:osmoprotectant transport system ATP-binding protein